MCRESVNGKSADHDGMRENMGHLIGMSVALENGMKTKWVAKQCAECGAKFPAQETSTETLCVKCAEKAEDEGRRPMKKGWAPF